MNIDTIKDVVTARLAFIASNAEEIAKTARACENTGDLSREAINEMFRHDEDLNCNIWSLENLLNSIEPKEEPKNEVRTNRGNC